MSSETELEERIRELLTPIVNGPEAMIDSVSFHERQTPPLLQVVVDRVTGTDSMELNQVAELSRSISKALDTTDPIAGEYTLEVSTPGAESDLKRLRHYERNLGRMIQVKLRDGDKLLGRLESADENGFTLELEDSSRYVEYPNVRRARPRVDFGEERP